MAAELGDGIEPAIAGPGSGDRERPRGRRPALRRRPRLRPRLEADRRRDRGEGPSLADRALELLRRRSEDGDADFGRMDDDPAFDPIRDDPAFAEIMKAGHPDRRYAAVWSSEANVEMQGDRRPRPGRAPRARRELIDEGYRPVAWSVAPTTTDGPPVTASVWHRPVVSEEDKDRAGRAAGPGGGGPGPPGQGRGGLAAPAAQPRSPAPQLHRQLAEAPGGRSEDRRRRIRPHRRSGRPQVASRPARTMDAILFDPETSIRRALILALGTYGADGLSPGEREPLIDRLLELYRDDPDAGIHGAAEWTLRQWKQQEKLRSIDAELDEAQGPGRPALVRQRPGPDVRRDRRPGRVPHGLAGDRAGADRRERAPAPDRSSPAGSRSPPRR